LGCMNICPVYGTPPSEADAQKLLLTALDEGVDFFDTAALYGFGESERIIGKTLSGKRSQFTLASKCGLHGVDKNGDGKKVRVLDGRPETLRATCENSLRSLKTDVIDLYYLHRWDKSVPIEDSVGMLSDLVRAGKIRTIGLSEVSAQTLRKAHAVHPITALQTEYSLWTRNPEIAVLDACRELGITFVSFSPLARKFLCGDLKDTSALLPTDWRHTSPRFHAEHYAKNLQLLDHYLAIARDVACTPAQLALAWVLHQAPHIVTIPGTSRIAHLKDNMGALTIELSPETLARLDQAINQHNVSGNRYNELASSEVDTEVF
ncbi:MAG: aldo/keto reductase, partial [Betaproteobacteria bacterium]|nr:aldo/keto reductase [Betaproteobacteria bacterium]